MLDFFFFFQAEDGIRDIGVTGVQTCALPILEEEEEEGGQEEFRMDAETGTERHGVRIHVDSPNGVWKNVEMSGYFRLLDGQDEFTLIARHGPSYHDDGGCDAYGYYGMLSAEGDAFFKKKTYHHGGGYT